MDIDYFNRLLLVIGLSINLMSEKPHIQFLQRRHLASVFLLYHLFFCRALDGNSSLPWEKQGNGPENVVCYSPTQLKVPERYASVYLKFQPELHLQQQILHNPQFSFRWTGRTWQHLQLRGAFQFPIGERETGKKSHQDPYQEHFLLTMKQPFWSAIS